MSSGQFDLFGQDAARFRPVVAGFLADQLAKTGRPSAHESLRAVEQQICLDARWAFRLAIADCSQSPVLRGADRAYFSAMMIDGSIDEALRGEWAAKEETVSTIDALLRQSAVYRSSTTFREMIAFMGRFKSYSAYNNMLVRVQNPSCGFFATARDWREKHGRHLIEDARPMLILAPMHPVLLVYDLDQTDGWPLPQELLEFSRFEGEWRARWLSNLVENARRHRIKVDFKKLSSTHGGFATYRGSASWKRRIAVHDGLDASSRFGVLAHEMGHILLGHTGSDDDHWWPSRLGLDHNSVEVEAESVAHLVTMRFGLRGASAAYLSRHVRDEAIPAAVSLDHIAKVAGRIEQMANGILPPPRIRPPRRLDRRSARG